MKSSRIVTSLSLIIAAVTLAVTFSAKASGGGGHGGGGEGGGEGEKKEGAADKPWMETQNRISALTTKTRQQSDHLNELIEEKKKTRDSAKMLELDKQINAAYKAYKESNAELRRQEQVFKYRYPERVAREGERVYQTQEVQSLEQIEEQVGIEGKLQRNMLRMRGQYGSGAAKKKVPVNKAEPAKAARPGEEEKNIREQDSLILKK